MALPREQIHIQVDSSVLAELRKEARTDHRSVQNYIGVILEKFLLSKSDSQDSKKAS